MKVVAFNGSPRKGGNTEIMVGHAFAELEKEGIETELIQIGGKPVRGCTACYKCFDNTDKRCAVGGDMLNDCIEKMLEADGIILASPTYFANVSTEMKALIDRAGLVSRANDDMFRRKAGAAIVAVRRGGAVPVFDAINHFFLLSQMVVPGSIYWNLGFGLQEGDVNDDEEGIRTMTTLGANMAWLLKRIVD
ncbi:MAG TPA: flavodoxin family protein [Armatimonadota bacterium]|nr:flavodoxin family protein [Armatimonadota bacterium]